MANAKDHDDYNATGAWFLGPRGENTAVLTELLSTALQSQVHGRQQYYPADESPVNETMIASATFQKNLEKLRAMVVRLGPELAAHSVPFWNPRYNAHMNMDTSLPGIVGYFTAMLSNPNNVATEASPLTTAIEITVGNQLCELIGYNTSPTENIVSWGHITCGGSIANLESMWAARNLKFYPLSLRLCMEEELKFIADSFTVPTCAQDAGENSKPKLLKDFTLWELLNITPTSILDIPSRLLNQYGITGAFLEKFLKRYLVQSIGMEKIEQLITEKLSKPTSQRKQEGFGLNAMAYFASATMHYSWPKGAGITGIGSDNMIPVPVDESARMVPESLRKCLQECLDAQRAVYAVVAIIGSTEHGACDPLKDILDIREEFQKKGMSFVVHADGAWGTYFAAAIPQDVVKRVLRLSRKSKTSSEMYSHALHDNFVPTLPLKPKTIESIVHMRFCDSITVDPHKSGYIQYPAGGLLYADGRMRFLVTWKSPIVYRQGEAESIGVYGVEGSKPGAAPVAAFFSHVVIGLNPKGYGQLLGQALFSGVKMYAHLATMSTSASTFVLRPLNLLPAEENASSEEIEEQKEEIRNHILGVNNRELADSKHWKLLVEMGSDLSINAFVVNFKLGDTVNEDIVEANYLNQRIFKKLSITSVNDKAQDKPLILTSTVLADSKYGACLATLKERLGLKGPQDLYTLVNVVMSPWPTADDLTRSIALSLEAVIKAECETSVRRNTLADDGHGFVIQDSGLDSEHQPFHFVHLAMFNVENHRRQLIISGTLDHPVLSQYRSLHKQFPDVVYLIANKHASTLNKILSKDELDIVLVRMDDPYKIPIAEGKLSGITVVADRKLNSKYLDPYPERSMPFFVYSTGGGDAAVHMDHVYTASPNIQLSAENVHIDHLAHNWNEQPLIYAHLPLPEYAMHPFPPTDDNSFHLNEFFFRPNAKFDNVLITKDIEGKEAITTTSITLGTNVFVDTSMLNENPEDYGKPDAPHHHITDPSHEPSPPAQTYADIIRRIESTVASI
ncbi:hypothetical protein HGRIS_013830 [Hohenbuehelia grisea]|uniref:PLP-dependent transferase n=1 Tax=Hohenbuehelia grisea TaxID=104357 RepID=A0ABR3IWS8_9AGAR